MAKRVEEEIDEKSKNIMGYTSRFECVILRAGAMLIFSVLFQF